MKYIAQYTQIDENDNINLNNIEIAVGLLYNINTYKSL